MKRKVHLHGRLKKLFGSVHEFDVATAAEAIRALNCAFPSAFMKALEDGYYRIIRGKRSAGFDLDLELVTSMKLGEADLHIIPVASGGAGGTNKGAAKTIAGIALIGAAIFFSGGTLAAPLAGMGAALIPGIGGVTFGTVALIGGGLVLAGAASLLSKSTDAAETDDTKKDQSFAFNGPVNVNEQGTVIPLIYGQVITGGQPISTGVDIEDINAYGELITTGGYKGSGTK